MNENKLLAKLKKISLDSMKKGLLYHDHVHVMAVYANVEKLLKYEKGDRLALLTAALFHDIKRSSKDHGAVGAKYAKKILLSVKDFPRDSIDSVVRIIDVHNKKQSTRDEKIFFDADIMDAFSSLGIVRSFMMSAERGLSLEEASKEYISLVDIFYKKLHTKTAKRLIRKDYEKCRLFALELLNMYK